MDNIKRLVASYEYTKQLYNEIIDDESISKKDRVDVIIKYQKQINGSHYYIFRADIQYPFNYILPKPSALHEMLMYRHIRYDLNDYVNFKDQINVEDGEEYFHSGNQLDAVLQTFKSEFGQETTKEDMFNKTLEYVYDLILEHGYYFTNDW